VLGRANLLLSRYADGLALGVAATRRVPAGVAVQVTGNPVRPAITALAGREYVSPGVQVNLLVLGGSLGARVFSDVVPTALAGLPASLRERVSVVQQCRGEDLPRVASAYKDAGIKAELSPFFAGMAEKLAAAHLVIARAGASTCAELAVAGRPAILVPLPGAIDDHQAANAEALQNVGGAWVIAQREFTAALLTERLTMLLNSPMMLSDAAESASSVGVPYAADSLADMVERAVMAGAEA
jgi:UDP-N-acetylglucosamine--N-acetylmuramyl-(pentapeptide) pyrophosphoryl-undecaprenol N-acetylglucosamine transferase